MEQVVDVRVERLEEPEQKRYYRVVRCFGENRNARDMVKNLMRAHSNT